MGAGMTACFRPPASITSGVLPPLYFIPTGIIGLRALNESLCAVSTPLLAQGESIGVDSTGALYVTSEGKKAPLYRLPAQCAPDGAASGDSYPGD